MPGLQRIAQIIGILLLATTFTVGVVATLVLALDYVLLIFLGVLLSVFLTKLSQLVAEHSPLTYAWSLGLVTASLLLLTIGGLAKFGSQIHTRLQNTSQKLDESVDQLADRLRNYPLALDAVQRIPYAEKLVLNGSDKKGDSAPHPSGDKPKQTPSADLVQSAAGNVFTALREIFSTTLGLVANAGLIFFIGIFIAANPDLYRDGFARLFPPPRQQRVREVMNAMGNALFHWLQGRLLAMLVTGGGTALALFVLGVPMAVTVGFITGLLTFIPNIGGVIALALAVLLALPQGLSTTAWVVGLYLTLQLLESNVLTPLIQQRQTSIPPALLLAFQVIMGAVAGFLGLMVATPLLAALLVLIKQVWIKDMMGAAPSQS